MPTPTFQGTVEEGTLKIFDIERFNAYLQGLDGKVSVVVRKRRKPRSDNENRYYWGVVVKILSDETGHLPDEIHEALKHKFLMDGLVAKSTAMLSTVEMEEYLSRIRTWASMDMNIYIPEPNEVEA